MLEVARDSSTVARLLSLLLTRPPSEQAKSLIVQSVGEAFVEAVRLSLEVTLHGKWRQGFQSHARDAIAFGLSLIRGVRVVSHAVSLIDFSTEHDAKPSAFVNAAGRLGPSASAAEKTDLDVYLLVLCIRKDLVTAIPFVSDVLPRVRDVALDNGFSERARSLLDGHLPYLSERWDLNKRLLKLLRNARRHGADITAVVHSMSLSNEELLYVFDEGSDDVASIISRLFWPFRRI